MPALRLIETWDVLKYVYDIPTTRYIKINRNMRCIEMNYTDTKVAELKD